VTRRTFKVTEQVPTQVDIEVEFPIYAKSEYLSEDRGSSVWYIRTVEGPHPPMLHSTVITLQFDLDEITGAEFETRKSYGLNSRQLDYELGRGEHASSAEEYATAYQQAVDFIGQFKP
jgi:hypothetical protein